MSDELTLRGREILVNLLDGRKWHSRRDPDGKCLGNRNKAKSLCVYHSLVPTYVIGAPPEIATLTPAGRSEAEAYRRRLTRRRVKRSRERLQKESGKNGRDQNT